MILIYNSLVALFITLWLIHNLVFSLKMRYSWCKASGTKSGADVRECKEEYFRQEFENAMQEGRMYGDRLKKGKRFRSAFTTEQVNYLEKEFRKYPYIGNSRRKDVANVLNIPERAVKIWFQNRRMKEKKDTIHKDIDVETKTEVANDRSNNVRAFPSANDQYSLPITTVSAESPKGTRIDKTDMSNKSTGSGSVKRSLNTDKSFDRNLMMVSKKAKNSSFNNTKHNPASTSKTSEYCIEIFKKYKNEPDVCEKYDEKKLTLDKETQPKQQISQTISDNQDSFKTKQQTLQIDPYLAASAMPQDLSSCKKSNTTQSQCLQEKSNLRQDHHTNVSNADIPVYLKGYYTQPCIPPGNMIWKPINISPILSTEVSAVTITNNTGSLVAPQLESMPRKCCNCDCHTKPYAAPVVFQQSSPNPHMQYVITALPFQNQSPKF